MPYDDPILREFAGYLEAREPGRRERADAWATAIGLQKVDGLTPSDHLYEVARQHIEGDISAEKARSLVDAYYETKTGRELPEELREADKVSARIIEVINDGGFDLSPSYFAALHALIFEDVLKFAGGFREVNIRKHEWVLKDDSVTYGDWKAIESSLDYAFDREKKFSYARKRKDRVIEHFSEFIATLWKIHPFREGNTRTTAVFAIKYLKELGYSATNNMFRENSWYFRNALVRACYENAAKGIARTFDPLEQFFRNLLLGETKELKSRYLLIGLNATQRKELKKGCQKKVVRKGCQKTADRILKLLKNHPNLTQAGLVAALGISRQAIQKHLSKLKAAGVLRRIGPDKGGHWEVVSKS